MLLVVVSEFLYDNDNDDNVQTNFSIGIANSHSWLLITPSLGPDHSKTQHHLKTEETHNSNNEHVRYSSTHCIIKLVTFYLSLIKCIKIE